MDYSDGYREGALAERRRAILIALRALDEDNRPSDVGHIIAHAINDAGDKLPVLIGPPEYGYTAFGERRLRAVPSALEKEWGPFTVAGRDYVKYLETSLELLAQALGWRGHNYYSTRVIDIHVLEERLATEKAKVRKLQRILADWEATTLPEEVVESCETLVEQIEDLAELMKKQQDGVIR